MLSVVCVLLTPTPPPLARPFQKHEKTGAELHIAGAAVHLLQSTGAASSHRRMEKRVRRVRPGARGTAASHAKVCCAYVRCVFRSGCDGDRGRHVDSGEFRTNENVT